MSPKHPRPKIAAGGEIMLTPVGGDVLGQSRYPCPLLYNAQNTSYQYGTVPTTRCWQVSTRVTGTRTIEANTNILAPPACVAAGEGNFVHSPTAKSSTPVVLVVEDEIMIRLDIADRLREAGYDVVETDSAEDALSVCAAAHAIDILFTDIQLNGPMSGWELAQTISIRYPSIRILYASGNSVDLKRCVPGGRFFKKPYRGDETLQACRQASG